MDYSGIPRSFKPGHLGQAVNDTRRHLEQLASARTGVNEIAGEARDQAIRHTDAAIPAALEVAIPEVLMEAERAALEQANAAAGATLEEADRRLAAARAELDASIGVVSGIAGSKGENIYQVSPPTGSRAVPQNLWIRSTDNKLHRWNPDSLLVNKWEPAIQLDVSELTAASSLSTAVAQRIAANTGQFISLAVSQLTVGDASMAVGVIDKLFTDVVRAKMVTSDAFIGENAILTGAITAPKITASEELTAKVAQFLKVTAKEINTEALWADQAWLTKANAQVLTLLSNTDGSGYTSTITGQGMLVTYTAPDGTVQDVIKLGTFGEDRFAIYRDGLAVVSFGSDGVVAAQGVEAAESLVYRGRELQDSLDLVGGGVYNYTTGTELDYGAFGGTGQVEVGNVVFYGLASVDFIVTGNRMVNITFQTPTLSFPVAGGEIQFHCKIRMTSPDDTSPITEANSATFQSFIRTNPGSGAWHDHILQIYRPITAAESGQRIQILIMAMVVGASYCRVFNRGRLTVVDAGQLPANPSVVKNSGGGKQYIASGTAPTVAPTPSKTQRIKTFNATQVRSYLGSGATYNYGPGKGYQGLQPYTSNGNLKSMFLFPDFAPFISGSTIDKIELELLFEHWYYGNGGTARIHLHSYLNSLPSTFDATYSHAITNWSTNSRKRFALSSGVHAAFLSGAWRGFGLGGDGTLRTYGIVPLSSVKIHITYTK